jgi:hypothetical protein
MKVISEGLAEPGDSDETAAQKEELLEELTDICESIDFARGEQHLTGRVIPEAWMPTIIFFAVAVYLFVAVQLTHGFLALSRPWQGWRSALCHYASVKSQGRHPIPCCGAPSSLCCK